jgi:hypothetical protein
MPFAQHVRTVVYFTYKASKLYGLREILQSDERLELRNLRSTSIFPVKCEVFRKGSFLMRKKTGWWNKIQRIQE